LIIHELTRYNVSVGTLKEIMRFGIELGTVWIYATTEHWPFPIEGNVVKEWH